jgi:hypothetical protein
LPNRDRRFPGLPCFWESRDAILIHINPALEAPDKTSVGAGEQLGKPDSP